MVRHALIWATIGIFAGAIAVAVTRDLVGVPWLSEASVDEKSGTIGLRSSSRNRDARTESAFSLRRALYEDVSLLRSAGEYEAAIWAARDSDFPAASERLGLLLDGLWEIDPQHAIRILQELSFSRQHLASVLERWVRNDSQRAISVLRNAYDPRVEEALAIEIIAAVGYESDLIRQLAVAGRTLDVVGLTAAFSIRSAEDSPGVALEAAEDIESYGARAVVLEHIARVLGEIAPEVAVLEAGRIVDPAIRSSFLNEAYKKWAISDVTGFLGHLKNANPNNPFAGAEFYSAVRIAGEADPYSALAVAEELSGSLGETVLAASLEALAQKDPSVALEYLSSTTLPWNERRAITKAIAAGFARFDVSAAAEWLVSLTDAETRSAARFEVLQELSATDLAKAIELELALPELIGVAQLVAPGWLHVPNLNELADPAEIANGLATREGSRKQVLLNAVVRRWADEDPDSALQWVVSRPSLAEELVESVATSVGHRDITQALSRVQSLPETLRVPWVRAAVQASATHDPEFTVGALQALQNEMYRDAGMLDVTLYVVARFGPEDAARLAGLSPPETVVASIARTWARSEPADALQWAMRLPESSARTGAVRDIFSHWAATDAQDAMDTAAAIADNDLRQEVQMLICQRAPVAHSCG